MSDYNAMTGTTPGGFTPRAKPDPETMCAHDLRKHYGRRIYWAYMGAIAFIAGGNLAMGQIFNYHPSVPEQFWFYCSLLLLIFCHRARLAALDARARGRSDRWFLGERIGKLETELPMWNAEYCRMVGSSEERTDKRMRQLEDTANGALARLDERCAQIDAGAAKRLDNTDTRLDAAIEEHRLLKAQIHELVCFGFLRKPGGSPVPYSNGGVCRDAADADGAIFDALELVAKGEQGNVPEHIETGDKVIWLRLINGAFGGGTHSLLTVGIVKEVTRATVTVGYEHNLTDLAATISRDVILAHCPHD